MPTRILLAIAVCIVALLGWWAFLGSGGVATPTNPGAAPDGVGAELHQEQTPGREGKDTEARHAMAAKRSEQGAGTPSPPGLEVAVTWSDGSKATNVAVDLRHERPGQPRFVLRRAVSDATGLARFADLTPGRVSVTSRRSKLVKVDLVAGQVAKAAIQLPKGVEVTGRVVDHTGRGVADAGIWLTTGRRTWGGGRIVTRSDADGRFHVRDAIPRQSLGAIASGFAPSKLVDLDDASPGKEPCEIELQLTALGGTVTGQVTAADGTAVERALVCLGAVPRRFPQRRGMGSIEQWTPLVTYTDPEGRYVFPGVAPGSHPIGVYKPPFARNHAKLEVAAQGTTQHDVQLSVGFTVFGRVTTPDGKPAPGAVVRGFDKAIDETFLPSGQYDYEGVFDYPFTSTDPTGNFELIGLAAGKHHLYAAPMRKAGMGEARIRIHHVLEGDVGERREWNPVLDRGHTIVGTVTFQDGAPMKHHFINLRENRGGKASATTTNAKGEFQFFNLKPAHYTIDVQLWNPPKGSKPLVAEEVFPDRGPVRIVASWDSPEKRPKGTVTGRIDDVAGRLKTPGALIVVLEQNRSWRTDRKPKNGRFEFRGVAPGESRVVALSGEEVIAIGPKFQLAPGETKDVGTIVTKPGGALRIKIQRGPGTENEEPSVYVSAVDTMQSRQVRPGTGNSILVKNLCTGPHRITIYGKRLQRIRREVVIRAGQTTGLDIDFERAAIVPLEIRFPNKDIGRLELNVLDQNGKSVRDSSYPGGALDNPFETSLKLPPGRYTVVAKMGTRTSGEHAVTVTDTATEFQPLRLEVK